MPPIRTIYWDVGGVLLTNGWDHTERAAVLNQFGVDKATVDARHEAANDPWEKGEISVWEYLDRTIFFEPRDFTPQQFFAAMKQQSQWLSNGAIEILRGLAAAKNHTIVILNNESAELHDYRMEKFNFGGLFDAAFCSAYVGLRKPDAAIFRVALRVMQTPAEEAVFIDDRKSNAEAASALGMHGIQFQSPQQLAQALQGLGIVGN
jgi:putative hydrolase of the HAD superfamily